MPNKNKIRRHHLRVPVKDYVVVDLEMTGLSVENSEIIQVSAIKYQNDQKVATFNTLVKPEHSEINSFVEHLTHITNDDVADSPVIADVIPKLETFVGDLPIVGHNINFDIKFLIANDFYKADISSIDTLKLANAKMAFLANKRLQTLKEYFGIDNVSHNALNDCVTTAAVYKHLRDDKLHAVANPKDGVPHVIAGTKFVLAGNFDEISKTKLTQTIRKFGGSVSTNASFKTNYLIMEKPELASQFDDTNIANAKTLIEHGDKIQVIDLPDLKNIILQKAFTNSNQKFIQNLAS
ncbi:exonuclease domain-containing protein [Fructilactobacillus sp. Tb1]|uniref:exonuclease domain-containing protein n=1 Tax=Fructilactobacillus sp. Tb1 TaxID=3422304 RepID=UPI003D2AE382